MVVCWLGREVVHIERSISRRDSPKAIGILMDNGNLNFGTEKVVFPLPWADTKLFAATNTLQFILPFDEVLLP